MVTPKQKTQSGKKNSKAAETSQSIESHINDFLKSGGQIEMVGQGVSGRESMAGKKPEENAKS